LTLGIALVEDQAESIIYLRYPMKAKLCLSILTLNGVVLSANIAQSQTYQPSNRIPVVDNTLGTQVSGSNSNFSVTGGLSRGQNLFHSFTDFSVPNNGSVTFTNPVGSQSIITRVTGNLFSDINGKVDTNGANFFLINPNGIVFGNNVQLNVGKSFVGSTANGIDLVDPQGKVYTFGTKNINDVPLLTINPNVLLNVSRLNMGASVSTDVGIKNYGALQTNNDNQYIGLIGGNVTLDGSFGTGDIIAPGGRVDLGGLKTAGTVSLDDRGFVFYGNSLGLSDVSILGGAWVDARTSKSYPVDTLQSGSAFYGVNKVLGTIDTSFNNVSSRGSNVNINANNVTLFSDIALTNIKSSIKTSGGDININATEKLSLNRGEISTDNTPNNPGSTGNINISAQGVGVTNQSSVFTYTQGSNNAGDIKIESKGDIYLSGIENFTTRSSNDVYYLINSLSVVSRTFGNGNSGKITIATPGSLFVTNEAMIASQVAQRDSRINNITSIDAAKNVTGNSQGISISAGNTSLTNNSAIDASSRGKGNGGNIDIKVAGNMALVGDTLKGYDHLSGLTDTRSRVDSSAYQGFSGKISIDVKGNLSLDDSKISNESLIGKGSQGIDVLAREITIKNGSVVQSRSVGGGDAGNINIKATGDITVAYYEDSLYPYSAANVGSKITVRSDDDMVSIGSESRGAGKSGKILIDTQGKLSVINGASISSDVVYFSGDEIAGNSQGIEIFAKQLNLNNSGYIFATTSATARGGDINIKTTDSVNLNNSAILTGTRLLGNRKGESGNILIDSRQINIKNSAISTESIGLTGGNIALTTKDWLLMQPYSEISTDSQSPQTKGDGGNITINSPLVIATPGDNNITANASAGSGGRVNITSQGLFGIQFRPSGINSPLSSDITASSTFGQNGTVNISTPGIDPGKDANQLPTVPTDASNQISQTCSPSNRDSKFAVTGRGGLPKNAYDLLSSDVVWKDPRAGDRSIASNTVNQPTKKISSPAIGWVFDGKGKVTLIAAESQGQPTGTRVVCPNGEK
jgi:filamentous hemagglutinin family protein